MTGMRRVILLSALLSIAACGGEKESAALTPEEAIKKAESATNALMAALMAKLKPALEEGGPAHAVAVCSEVAGEIEAQVRREQGVSLRRTALRVRNKENAPDAYEEKWMRDAEAKPEVRLESWSEVVDGGRELRYIRPIYLKALCSKCHGQRERIQPQILEVIEKRYPDDQATGFLPGQLRGIVSVRVPLE